MDGPWLKYQQQQQSDGPWTKYQTEETAAPPAEQGQAGNISQFDLMTGRAGQTPEDSITASGLAKAGGIGLAEGVIGLAGLPGDIKNALTSGFDATIGRGLDYMLNVTPEQREKMNQIRESAFRMPGSADIKQGIETFTGPFYEPQNRAEKYMRTIGQFAPAVAGGPGTVLQKTTATVVPAVTSEAAGQMTEGTWAEPYARVAGAVLGGVASAGRSGQATRQMVKNAPTEAEVARQTSKIYDSLRNSNVVYDIRDYHRFLNQTGKKLFDEGYRPEAVKSIGGHLKALMNAGRTKIDFPEVERLRKSLNNLPKDISSTELRWITMVKKDLDDFIANGRVVSDSKIPPQMIDPMVKQARELARRNILADQMKEMSRKAEEYVSGAESGLRNQVSSYLKSEGKNLTQAEKDALRTVVRREGLNDLVATTGGRLGGLGGAAIGGTFGGIPGAAAGWLGHVAARKLGEVYAKKGMDKALNTILAGKTAQTAAAAADRQIAKEILFRRLMAIEGATVQPRLGGGSSY